MQLIDRDPRSLHPADYNPRRMSVHDGERLQQSIRDWGWLENVVVNARTGRIVSGHMRVQAAIAAGVATVPVHEIDVDDVTERQINLAMNRVRGEWDDDKLAETLAWLQTQEADLGKTGFQDAELAKILDGVCDVGLDAVPADDDARRWELVVECDSEAEQQERYERLRAEGWRCRVLTL